VENCGKKWKVRLLQKRLPSSSDLGEGVVEYENEAAYPEPAFEASVDVPKAVPYLGGKQLGILESQAKASVNASSGGEGKLGLEGQTGLGLGAFNIAGELGGEGQFKFQMGDGLRMDKAKLKLGISTPFKKEMTLADLVPAIKAAEEWWWVGKLIKKVTRSIVVEGAITPKISIEADFAQKGRDAWVFEGSVARGELALKVTATFKPYEKLWVQVYGGGTPFLEFNFPAKPDYFRRMGIDLDFGALLHAWRWEKEFKYGVTCALPGGCSSNDDRRTPQMTDDGWSLMGRAYVTADYNTFVGHTRPLAATLTTTMSTTSATAETPLIANVYPLTEPALAVRADGAASSARTLAYVIDDPTKPVGQGEELVVMQWDGASQTWTPPLTLTNDLRLDFAPQTAYDGAGNAVVVWERTYTDVVTSGLNLTFTQQLDIAAATWFSDTATWSAITMLTENDGRLDHSPRLRAGANGSLLALWQTSDGTDIMGAPGHPLTYTYATWDSAAQTWSAPRPAIGGLTDVIEMDVAVYSATQAALVYAVDTDGVITTTADAELYYSRYDGSDWAAPLRLTNDVNEAIADTTPALIYDDAGRLTLLWLRGGDLVMLRDDSWDVADAQLVRAESGAGGFHALSLSRSPEGHLALVWQGLQGDRVDLAYSVYDADAPAPARQRDAAGRIGRHLHLGRARPLSHHRHSLRLRRGGHRHARHRDRSAGALLRLPAPAAAELRVAHAAGEHALRQALRQRERRLSHAGDRLRDDPIRGGRGRGGRPDRHRRVRGGLRFPRRSRRQPALDVLGDRIPSEAQRLLRRRQRDAGGADRKIAHAARRL
jgi:hypothetical protein